MHDVAHNVTEEANVAHTVQVAHTVTEKANVRHKVTEEADVATM